MNLTKNFTLEEMVASSKARQLSLPNTPNAEQVENLRRLCEKVLQPLRDAYGKPIRVNSGYRSAAVNKAVGGVSTSQHLRGLAADITGGSVSENKRLFELIISSELPFDQLIDEHGYRWLHVSHTPTPRRMVLRTPKSRPNPPP